MLTQEQSELREPSVDAEEEYGSSYWDDVLNSWTDAPALDAWRDYMHRVYQRLLDRWVPLEQRRSGLKTDLFEEAVSSHPVLTEMGPLSIWIDCSTAVVRAAKLRLDKKKNVLVLAGDLRQLPICSRSRQYILCGSSLDHFDNFEDIAVCLAELNRVLVAGGTAIFTFDNPHNPVVWIRNHLPFRWLQRIGLVPYYVGRTYTKSMVREQLHAAGFDVLQITAVAHAPRAPAIALIATLERLGWQRSAQSVRRGLEALEWLQSLPTRYWTGYYIACCTRKRCELEAGA